MKYAITFAICALLALDIMVLGPRWAHAQSPSQCGSHEKIIKVLKDKFQETGIALGIVNETALVQVYASKGGATWTILSAMPNGFSCIIAAGKDWIEKPPEILGKNS